jgi:hypothetical protein
LRHSAIGRRGRNRTYNPRLHNAKEISIGSFILYNKLVVNFIYLPKVFYQARNESWSSPHWATSRSGMTGLEPVTTSWKIFKEISISSITFYFGPS